MHKPDNSPISLPDEAATRSFAAKLAGGLQSGMVVYLRGDLGAGKTTLVRSLLRELAYTGRVKSPTYTLLEQYEAGGLHFRHFDLYRFQDDQEWEAAGFRDEFDGRNVCLVEWPEKAHGLLPQADLEIMFEIFPDRRSIMLSPNTEKGSDCVKKIMCQQTSISNQASAS